MRTPEDKRKQAQVMMQNALAKRTYAAKLQQEADEEMIEASLILDDLEKCGRST